VIHGEHDALGQFFYGGNNACKIGCFVGDGKSYEGIVLRDDRHFSGAGDTKWQADEIFGFLFSVDAFEFDELFGFVNVCNTKGNPFAVYDDE
jgi:hypothetical protein